MQNTGKIPAYKPERLHITRPLIPDVSHGLYVSDFYKVIISLNLNFQLS
jgi:hypothetical protein